MWIVEFVKNVITGHMKTPIRNTNDGQRYARHVRLPPRPPRRRPPPRAGTARAAGSPSRTSSARARRAAASGVRGPRSAARATNRWKQRAGEDDPRAAAGRTATRSPAPCGCSSVIALRLDDRPARRRRARSAARATPEPDAPDARSSEPRARLYVCCCLSTHVLLPSRRQPGRVARCYAGTGGGLDSNASPKRRRGGSQSLRARGSANMRDAAAEQRTRRGGGFLRVALVVGEPARHRAVEQRDEHARAPRRRRAPRCAATATSSGHRPAAKRSVSVCTR